MTRGNSKRRWHRTIVASDSPLSLFSLLDDNHFLYLSLSLRFATTILLVLKVVCYCMCQLILKGKKMLSSRSVTTSRKKRKVRPSGSDGMKVYIDLILINFLSFICVMFIWNSRWDFQRNPNLILKGYLIIRNRPRKQFWLLEINPKTETSYKFTRSIKARLHPTSKTEPFQH